MSFKLEKKAVVHYLLLFIGAAILSFGLYNVHSRTSITEGGVLGMSLLLQHWFRISPSISCFIMDMTCYAIGFKLMGKEFLKSAITASVSFSLTYRLWEHTGYMLPDLSALPLAAAIVGAMFVGVGAGIVVLEGGASGGDDALALIISRAAKCRIARAYLVTDLTVLALSLTYIPWSKMVYCLVTVTLSSFVIDCIQRVFERLGRKPAHMTGAA